MKTNFLFKFTMLIVFYCLANINSSKSQNFQLIQSSGQSFQGSGPCGQFRWQRNCFIISQTEMFNAGVNNAQVFNYIKFKLSTSSSFGYLGSVKVYLQNSSNNNYQKGFNWTGILSGMTQVVSSPIAFPLNLGEIRINFNTNNFTYTGGAVYVAFEYSNPIGTPSSVNMQYLSNTSSVGGAFANASNASYLNNASATLVLNAIRPDLQMGFDFPIALTDPPPPCMGVPNPGLTLANSTGACPGQAIVFSLLNATHASGLSYQWCNANGPISGATNSTYSHAFTANDTMYCIVNCGGFAATSSLLPISLTWFGYCYCSSGAINTGNEDIINLTFDGISTDTLYSNANACSNVAPGPGSILGRYSNFHGTLFPATRGANHNFTLVENECDGAPYGSFGTAIWIDYNHNGSFLDNGEKVFVDNSTTIGPRTIFGSIFIPTIVNVGQTVMRITIAEGISGSALNPCQLYTKGETEDYQLDIRQCFTNLDLTCFIEGFMIGPNLMTPAISNSGIFSTPDLCDSIQVELYNKTTPSILFATQMAMLDTNGRAFIPFECLPAITMDSFYIRVQHRNSIDVWSALPQQFIRDSTTVYSFATANAQAFNSNQTTLFNTAAMFSGEINRDCNLDLLDYSNLEAAINAMLFGYVNEDLNGDGNVDLLDEPLLRNNLLRFLYCQGP